MSDVVGDGDDNDGIDALDVLLPLWRSVPSQLDDGAENAKGLGATHQADDDPPVFSLVSYNVLLPNSVDGWWCYKYYSHGTPLDVTEWRHRVELLRNQIALAGNPEVLCFQECSPESFDADFAFLKEEGYDYFLHPKGRFRCATFWKRECVSLLAPPVAKDRFIVTMLRFGTKRITVINHHLQAGNAPARRLRQAAGGMAAAKKELLKLLGKTANLGDENIVVCGDFNTDRSGSDEARQGACVDFASAVHNYLTLGTYANKELTSKTKSHVFASMRDVYESAGVASPTYICASLVPVLGQDRPSERLMQLLERIFDVFALSSSDGASSSWTPEMVDRWLVVINLKPGRGSEFRAASKSMIASINAKDREREGVAELAETLCAARASSDFPPSIVDLNARFASLGCSPLRFTVEDFAAAYASELSQGKYWGVAFDLAALGEPLDSGEELFKARFDYIYATAGMKTAAVLAADVRDGEMLPNSRHPSDHLFVGAKFSL